MSSHYNQISFPFNRFSYQCFNDWSLQVFVTGSYPFPSRNPTIDLVTIHPFHLFDMLPAITGGLISLPVKVAGGGEMCTIRISLPNALAKEQPDQLPV
ncbi:MAG: hypothetical protein IPH88_19620 [Bacteroidales bacterium]|nr:hypothetical protein [Bacteroidales bacterium]